jgi:hypothetical protein
VFCVLLCEDILIASLADLSLVVVLLVLPQAHAQALHVSQVCDVCARLRACGVCATKVMLAKIGLGGMNISQHTKQHLARAATLQQPWRDACPRWM